MNQLTRLRKNNRFYNGLEEIREYFRGHHGQVPEELTFLWETIFPHPQMNDYALNLPIDQEERKQHRVSREALEQ